jgi:hypothetical protein
VRDLTCAALGAPSIADVNTVLFVIGLRRNWEDYLDAVAGVARAEGARVRVLETAAPIGTGEFTSNPVMDDDYPVERVGEPTRVNPADRRAAHDTAEAARATNEYLAAVVAGLERRGVEASADWLPDLRREDLAAYARDAGATTIVLVRRNVFAELFQRPHINELERDGFRVIEVEPDGDA